MKLTEAKLKQLIIEELDTLALESTINEMKMPQLDIKDLIPKAKKMKATKGKEDLMQEGGFLLSAAIGLAIPKVLQWMGKFSKVILSNKKVYQFLAKNIGVVNKLALDEFVDLLTTKLGNFLHGSYLGAIKYSVVKPIKILAKLAGSDMSEKEEDELTEILFMMLLGTIAILGVSAGAATIFSGKAKAHAFELTLEALTTAIKAFEGTEYAGMVPAALKFLETSHGHH